MKILKEKRFPDVPEGIFSRGFSCSSDVRCERIMRIADSANVRGCSRNQNPEDSHDRCGPAMRNFEEESFPDVPECHFPRSFSLSLRAETEKPGGKVFSGGAKNPFPRGF